MAKSVAAKTNLRMRPIRLPMKVPNVPDLVGIRFCVNEPPLAVTRWVLRIREEVVTATMLSSGVSVCREAIKRL
jgi:hypothetical protein